MQAYSSAQRCHDGRSHALLEYVGLAAVVWRIVCLSKWRGNGVPPRAGPFGRRAFFRAFSAHFCVTPEHLFFKRQNVEEKSAENGRKNGRKTGRKKSAHQKSAQKWAQKSAHRKWAQKWAQKSAHQKSAQKTGLNIRFVRKMEARKKNTKKICAKLAQNPNPNKRAPPPLLVVHWSVVVTCVFLGVDPAGTGWCTAGRGCGFFCDPSTIRIHDCDYATMVVWPGARSARC